MGLRSRIKSRVKRILGQEEPVRDVMAPPGGPDPAPSRPVAPVSASAPAVAPAPPAPTAASPKERLAARARPAPEPGPAKIDEDKKRQARLKAKKAVLQFLIKEGGEAGMKEMHDFSERRYFVAHKAFSDLMEEYLAEELIEFDQETYRATLTDEGRRWVEAATHIKTREKL